MLAAPPMAGDVVYIERRGESYAWLRAPLDADMPRDGAGCETMPDVWIYYSGQWPAESGGPEQWRALLYDLLDEMESMAGGKDRCRWPFDDPWPHSH